MTRKKKCVRAKAQRLESAAGVLGGEEGRREKGWPRRSWSQQARGVEEQQEAEVRGTCPKDGILPFPLNDLRTLEGPERRGRV